MSVNSDILIASDVSAEGSLERTFKAIQHKWGKLDFFVHAVAFADKNLPMDLTQTHLLG